MQVVEQSNQLHSKALTKQILDMVAKEDTQKLTLQCQFFPAINPTPYGFDVNSKIIHFSHVTLYKVWFILQFCTSICLSYLSIVYHHHHFIRSKSSTVCQSSEQFNNIMSKTYQAHISAYGSLIVSQAQKLVNSKYSETIYKKSDFNSDTQK